MAAFKDHTGEVFGYLTVLRRALVTQGKKVKYICRCECGNETVVGSSNLTTGQTISCGCRRGKVRGEQLRLEYGLASKRRLFKDYKDSAMRREYCFELTFDQFIEITSSNCMYCGRSPSNDGRRYKRQYGIYIYNGVDRIDNTKGYLVVNCVPCCTICNRSKGAMNYDDFINWIKDIYNQTIGGGLPSLAHHAHR